MKFVPIRVHSWFRSLLWALPALIALAPAFYKLASPDVPLGLAWGRAIVTRGALPTTNVFSHMNPDHVVLLDKWLFQVMIYLLHSLAGPTGLVILRVALLAIALWAATRAAGICWNRPAHAWLAVIFTVALLNRCNVRAELVTWTVIPLMLLLIPQIRRGDKKGWLLLVLLQAIWANAHGYWIVGPLLWFAAGIGAAIHPLLVRLRLGNPEHTRPMRERLRLLIAGPAALASACLTPYGIRTIAHPFRLALELRNNDILSRAVDDFGSPLEAWRRGGTIPFWACCVMALAGILATVWLAKHRRWEGEKLCILALGFLLGLPMYRNMTVMAVCALPMIADALRSSHGTVQSATKRWLCATAALPAFLWISLAWGGYEKTTDYGARKPGFGWHLDRYPVAAAHWIARNTPDAKLWNAFTEGGWLNWRLGEGHTYIDGNTDGYPLAFLRKTHEAWTGDRIKPWISETEKPRVALVKYGGKDQHTGCFLAAISWLDSPVIGFADGLYCVVLASPDVPGAGVSRKTSLWRDLAERVQTGPLAEMFSLQALTAVPPDAPDRMYARSGRLAIWLYPEEPLAQAHFNRTCPQVTPPAPSPPDS